MVERSGLLVEIIAQFKDDAGALTAQQVADRLGKDAAVVSGMLDTLVQLGRLSVVTAASCDLCPLRAGCGIPGASVRCYYLNS
jgi:hypothetical protein